MNRKGQVTALYARGATYEQIGRQIGVTRERVRQLLTEYEISKTPRAGRVYDTAISGRESAIAALFYELRDDRAVAKRLKVDVAAVHDFVDRTVPDADTLRKRPLRVGDRYSSEKLGECLRIAAADLASPLTRGDYARWIDGRNLPDGRPWPTSQAEMLHFGSWRAAVANAMLPSDDRPASKRPYDLNDMTDAVVSAWRANGVPPTVTAYDKWRNGRSTLPSSAMSRHFAASWDDVVLGAYTQIHDRPLAGVGTTTPTR